jgi:hypothetical protein
MNNFFRDLLSDSGSVSSKRGAALWVLLLLTVLIIADQFTMHKINSEVFQILVLFMFSCFGLNTILSAKSLNVKKEVASDMVTATGDNDSAKETLQADKPKG